MIVSLRGVLVHKEPGAATVECAGVGYGLAMSHAATARLPALGDTVYVLVHTHMSQDALRLFGFVEASERRAFEVLVGTSGVGPKLALAILSTLDPDELATAVARRDKGLLTRIPGVGGKKAERLLVELKDRLTDCGTDAGTGLGATLRNDLLSALANLGFAPQVAERAARHALQAQPAAELTVLVREALRATTARN